MRTKKWRAEYAYFNSYASLHLMTLSNFNGRGPGVLVHDPGIGLSRAPIGRRGPETLHGRLMTVAGMMPMCPVESIDLEICDE